MSSSRVAAVACLVAVCGIVVSPQLIFTILAQCRPQCIATSTDWRPIAELSNEDSFFVQTMPRDFSRPLLLRKLVPDDDPIFELSWDRTALANYAGGHTVFVDLAEKGKSCENLVSVCDEGVFNQSSCNDVAVPAQAFEALRSSAYRDSYSTEVKLMWDRSALSMAGLIPGLHIVYKNDPGIQRGSHFDPVWTLAIVLQGERDFVLHDTHELWNCFKPSIPGRTTSQATQHRCDFHGRHGLVAHLEAGDALFIPEWWMHAAVTPERVGNDDSTLLTFRGSRFRQTFRFPTLAVAFSVQILMQSPEDLWDVARYFLRF